MHKLRFVSGRIHYEYFDESIHTKQLHSDTTMSFVIVALNFTFPYCTSVRNIFQECRGIKGLSCQKPQKLGVGMAVLCR